MVEIKSGTVDAVDRSERRPHRMLLGRYERGCRRGLCTTRTGGDLGLGNHTQRPVWSLLFPRQRSERHGSQRSTRHFHSSAIGTITSVERRCGLGRASCYLRRPGCRSNRLFSRVLFALLNNLQREVTTISFSFGPIALLIAGIGIVVLHTDRSSPSRHPSLAHGVERHHVRLGSNPVTGEVAAKRFSSNARAPLTSS